MWKQLSHEAVKTRLIRLNNLEKMYATQVERNKKLKKQVKKLKAENTSLKDENRELRDRVQKLELIVEELQSMIFKKSRKKKDDIEPWKEKTTSKKDRDKASYKREVPSEDEVTDTEVIEVGWCSCCWWELSKMQEVIRYIEDMILPLEQQYVLKKVIKQLIQKWYCKDCKKRTYGKDISSQHCTLWVWVKAFIVYGITTLMLSYEQVKNFLETMVNMKVSDGEIVNILKKEAIRLTPEHEEMKERIRAWPWIHMDETVWNVQSWDEKRYAWVMSDTYWEERVYILWESRWMWNVGALKWDSWWVWITDNYGAYKNAFDHHQLCWAHPIRKMRDLVSSKKLDKLTLEICKVAYDKLREVHMSVLSLLERREDIADEREWLLVSFDELTMLVAWEPEKLKKIKESLERDKRKYFTCLDFKDIPTTNNTAERALRPLVIKRKLSFGSKTSDGARMMEVIYSIVFSLLAKSKQNFFDRYLAL